MPATSAARRRRLTVLGLTLALTLAGAYTLTSAQTPAKRALTVDDYTRWRSISGQAISGDGNWVSYDLQLTNVPTAESKPVLHLLKLGTTQDTTIADATGAAFSSDSQWIAYQVDPGGGRGGRGGRAGGGAAAATTTPATPPDAPAPAAPGAQGQNGRGARGTTPAVPRHVELRNLATGAVQSWQDIQSFTFSSNAAYLLLRRRPAAAEGRGGGTGTGGGEAPGGGAPAEAGASAGGTETAAPRGADMILHNLATGRDQPIGSAGDAAFNKAGDLLAYTVDSAVRDGNGLFVIDLSTGGVTALENDAKAYNRLTWNDAGNAIAVLKGTEPEKMRERANTLVVYRGLAAGKPAAAAVVLDPAKASGVPADWIVSDRAALTWSDDDHRVFFGMKAQVPATAAPARANADETVNVDVWTTHDERIQSQQMIRADQDRNFTFREAFDVAGDKFVKLADETMRDLDVAPDGRWAVGRDTRGYISDYKPAAADIYRVNTTTGERTLMFKNLLIGANTFGISTDGHFFLYWKDSKYQAYDLDAGTSKALGGPTPPALTNAEYDHPGVKPAYGIAGYSSDGKAVIVDGKYDLWSLPLDGSAAKNLTNGAGTQGEIRFRYVRTEPAEAAGPGGPGGGPGGGRGGRAGRETIDLAKPITLSAYGEWTKKAGFYELADGKLREVVYEDAAFSNPTKAAKAEKFLFTRQTFVEFPDLRVSGPDFKNSTKLSDANPQQSEFLWGHRLLFDFKDRLGHRLQGMLAIPDDYKPGEKRPMLVNFYEDNSQNLNRYSAPSYLTGMGSSPIQGLTEGYLLMIPDVHYHTGASHSDQLDSVEAAVKRVIEMGYADPKHIGINGHSYGGEGAAFIATRSRLFAAVGVGAGVVDLYNDFNMNWGWSYQVQGGSGANGDDYYLYGQGREAVSPWDNPEMYHFESALTHVPEVTQPILIEHGTADPTVGFINGLAFYNALRYNNKNAILLAYQNEGHGLRGLANRRDLTIRYFQFFDHYLKGAPAPKWMTDGVPFLDKDKVIK